MEKEYYMNAGIPTQGLLEPQSGMQPWNSFSLPQELNSTSQFTPSCLLNSSHWDKQNNHFTRSSSAVPTSSVLNDSVGIREFIAKLGPNRNSARNPPPFPQASSNHHISNTNGCNAKQQGVSILPALSTDPEFAERAAKFSCFGSRSFNARTSHSTLSDRSSSAMARVWSSPSLKQSGCSIDNEIPCQTQMEIKKLDRFPSIDPNSNESSSSASEHVPSGETVSKVQSELHSRKRKVIPKIKAKENVSPTLDSHKVGEADDGNYEKRAKTAEASPSENGSINKEDGEEERAKNGVNEALDEQHKPDKMTQKPTDPPKDYIHVRARRGQATDSHSLAERVRREKIGERMKLLQDLVPGCNKVTGKALMLDEIINYVQSLQCQVEFLSMKLASVDARQDVNVDNFTSKDVMQRNSFYPVDTSVQGLYSHQPKQYPRMHTDTSLRQSPVEEPIHKTLSHNLELQLPSLNEFVDCLPQFPAFCEEDLHSIVGMGFSQNVQMEADFIQ